MTLENKISFQVPAEDMEAIEAAIKVLQDKLSPLLISLIKDERVALNKMGDKNIAFIEKCKEYMVQNPSLTPEYIEVEEMKVDMEAVTTLRSLLNPVEQIASAIDDTMMLSGSEAYAAALAFYYYIKGAVKINKPGAKNIYDDLKKQFKRKSDKKNESSDEETES